MWPSGGHFQHHKQFWPEDWIGNCLGILLAITKLHKDCHLISSYKIVDVDVRIVIRGQSEGVLSIFRAYIKTNLRFITCAFLVSVLQKHKPCQYCSKIASN